MLKGLEFIASYTRERHDLRVNPRLFIDGAPVGGTELERDALGRGHVDGFAETVIDWPYNTMTSGTYAVANRQQVSLGIHVQSNMLHRTGFIDGSFTGFRLAVYGVWTLDESKRASVAEPQKAMKRFCSSVHPVECAELSADHFGEELDLRLNVFGVDREMI
jgi:hypothetical protein